MVLRLRDYQIDCVKHAKERNTIINLDTGKGKTLIAARLIDHFLEALPRKRIAFLVPTRPLVDQQSKYLEKHCRVSGRTPTVLRLVGMDQATWSQSDWDSEVSSCNILLGTAALFQKAFVTDKFVSLDSISLIVFDECHNAVGNAPMATVMRDAVSPHVAAGSVPPHILGLTASFLNGALKNVAKKRSALELLMNSTIFAPDVENALSEESYESVDWLDNPAVAQQVEVVNSHISKATQGIAIKEVSKVISRSTHVFSELGLTPLMFYMEKVVVKQLQDKADRLDKKEDDAGQCRNLARKIRTAVPNCRKILKDLTAKLRNDPELCFANEKSNKLLKLVEILKKNFDEHDSSYRGIVFVEQVALASTLAHEINDSLALIQCGAVAGTGHQTELARPEQLNQFKAGECRILVATATLEEGIDVSECEFVARFNIVKTTKAHIQGCGRARHPNAKIYYFMNNPTTERAKADEMTAIAQDATLVPSEDQMRVAMRDMNVSSQQHPYPCRFDQGGEVNVYGSNVGEVNVYNCKQIFNQYCSVAFGESISAKEQLYKYKEVGGCTVLDEVWYPTPDGWRFVCFLEQEDYWQDTDMDQVFEAARTTKKSSSQKLEMAFVYVAVVNLRNEGYLDSHNKTVKSTCAATKRECPLESREEPAGLNIQNNIFQSHNSS